MESFGRLLVLEYMPVPRSVRDIIAENLKRVHERIERACSRADRSASEVTLVAVTKYAEPEWIDALIELGVTELGESRPQQLVERAERYPASIHWHLIGHLQRNKARLVLPHTALCHSIDSIRLAERIDSLAKELKLTPKILLEVNVSGEEAKDGFDREELFSAAQSLAKLQHVRITGLMTMAPLTEAPNETRPVFGALRTLRDVLREQLGETALPDLSMGMSRDYEVACEEGATLVRIGRTLFEGLEPSAK